MVVYVIISPSLSTVAARYIAVGGQLDDNSKALQLLHSIQNDDFDYVLKSPSAATV